MDMDRPIQLNAPDGAGGTVARPFRLSLRLAAGFFGTVLVVAWLGWRAWVYVMYGRVLVVGALLSKVSPYTWASLGIAASVILSALGAGIGILTIASSLMGAAVRTPHVRTKNLIR